MALASSAFGIIVVLNLETIIPECEIIGNPKTKTVSESTTQKPSPNSNTEHPTWSVHSNLGDQVPVNNDLGGRNATCISISKETMSGGHRNDIHKTISQIKDEGLGRSDKPDWVTLTGTIVFIRTDNFCYTACPLMIGDRQRNKKVTRSGPRWLCDRCNQEFEECDYRYLLQLQIQDHTGLIWVTAFHESGEELMGCSARQLCTLKYELQDDVRFVEVVQSRLFNQYLFRLKIKEKMYNDEQGVKSTIVKVDKVDYISQSRYMLDMIAKARGTEH